MSEENVNIDDKDGKKGNKTQANNTETTPKSADNLIPKKRLDAVLSQRQDAIDALKSVADELAEDVPEDMRDIIPDLPPAAKITWIRNAMKKGIFTKQPNDGLDTKRPSGKAPLDLSNMNPAQMLATGYK